MPSKINKGKAAPALPTIPKELIDQFVDGPMSAEAVNAASMAFKKALIERALGAELTHHLGYAPGADKPLEAKNHRNGASGKTVLTEDGPLRIEVPRDRTGSFEPLLIPPDGHPKLLHLWPVKLLQAGRLNYRLFGLSGSDFLSW